MNDSAHTVANQGSENFSLSRRNSVERLGVWKPAERRNVGRFGHCSADHIQRRGIRCKSSSALSLHERHYRKDGIQDIRSDAASERPGSSIVLYMASRAGLALPQSHNQKAVLDIHRLGASVRKLDSHGGHRTAKSHFANDFSGSGKLYPDVCHYDRGSRHKPDGDELATVGFKTRRSGPFVGPESRHHRRG